MGWVTKGWAAMEGPAAADIAARKPAGSAPCMAIPALSIPPESPRAVSSLSTDGEAETQLPDNWYKIMAEREGFEPSKGF